MFRAFAQKKYLNPSRLELGGVMGLCSFYLSASNCWSSSVPAAFGELSLALGASDGSVHHSSTSPSAWLVPGLASHSLFSSCLELFLWSKIYNTSCDSQIHSLGFSVRAQGERGSISLPCHCPEVAYSFAAFFLPISPGLRVIIYQRRGQVWQAERSGSDVERQA